MMFTPRAATVVEWCVTPGRGVNQHVACHNGRSGSVLEFFCRFHASIVGQPRSTMRSRFVQGDRNERGDGADGFRYEVRNRMTLCRCGASRNKPFCDATHTSIRFTDEA
jgi:CDGSH-type Zn-finger protein